MSRELYEIAVINRLKEGGFTEIEIRTEALMRVGEGYQDEVINAGWHYWNAALATLGPAELPAIADTAPNHVFWGVDLADPAKFPYPEEMNIGNVVYRPVSAVIERIAKVSDAVAFQAGEPAQELAGQIVSVLAASPEHCERFMAEGAELFLDRTFNPENGCLSYRAVNGSIMTPAELRAKLGEAQ